MKTNFFKIEALTNMHPGSGDANFGVVDNLVQRDPATGLPVIHGSSLKGAIKEFFKGKTPQSFINEVFGDSDNHGDYRFLPALILAIPLRSNKKPYYMATSPDVIRQFLDLASSLKYQLDENLKNNLNELIMKIEKPKATGNITGLVIEDYEDIDNLDITLHDKTKELLGITNENLILLPDNEFVKITDANNLPVIARNQLDNGESKNLWYEQVIPRLTIFAMPVLVSGNDANWQEFDENITSEPVQIGGNASVGYGFTRFSHII